MSDGPAWNPDARPDDPDHWSHVLGADYTGEDCANCGRSRVLRYEEVDRFICEKCNWDQKAGQYAEDHERIG
jgi:ribosomal protein L37AE/L43A